MTSYNLFRHRLGDYYDSCPICLGDTESPDHLFRECPLALEAWSITKLTMFDIDNNVSPSFRSWLLQSIIQFTEIENIHSSSLSAFIGNIWAIWKTRDDQVFICVRATV